MRKSSKAQPEKRPSIELLEDVHVPVWEGTDYPRVTPGTYIAYVRKAKIYRDPQYKRWTCLVLFDVLGPEGLRAIARIPLWFNVTHHETGEIYVSRRGKYFPAWCQANGGPPARSDRMSPKVFVRREAVVQVGDTAGPAPYSVVKTIVQWNTGAPSGSTGHIIKHQGRAHRNTYQKNKIREKFVNPWLKP